MTVHPILFSAPMVRALLAGKKTQTRRALRPQPGTDFVRADIGTDTLTFQPALLFGTPTHLMLRRIYRPGDVLWVREAFSGLHVYEEERTPPRDWLTTDPIHYWADGNPELGDWTKPKPGIHMPRWASRLTLEVTNVRVERLQDISHDDAVAEGVGIYPISMSAQKRFREIWEHINGADSWAANPWIAAYTFTVHLVNVDAMPAARAAA